MDVSPNTACLAKSALDQTTLAGAKVRLFQVLTGVGANTTLALLSTNECDYDGYAAGGISLPTWAGPVLYPGGGAAIYSPTVLFQWQHVTDDVSNVATGWYIVLADGVTLWRCGTFDAPITMSGVGDGFPLEFAQVQSN